jgi:hypothetical protein
MLNGQTVCFEPLMDGSFFLPCVLLGLSSLRKVIGQTVSFDGRFQLENGHVWVQLSGICAQTFLPENI